jgi:hypothetical protein
MNGTPAPNTISVAHPSKPPSMAPKTNYDLEHRERFIVNLMRQKWGRQVYYEAPCYYRRYLELMHDSCRCCALADSVGTLTISYTSWSSRNTIPKQHCFCLETNGPERRVCQLTLSKLFSAFPTRMRCSTRMYECRMRWLSCA